MNLEELLETKRYKEEPLPPGKQRYVIKQIISKRVRQGHIEYLVEWHEATPKDTCWVPFLSLREALDAVGAYEFKRGQEKYRHELVHQLRDSIVDPMTRDLAKLKVHKPAIKVGGPRFGPRARKRTPEDEEDIELDFDEEVGRIPEKERPQLRTETKIIKCHRNNTERQLYFLVQWKGTFTDRWRGYTDLISAEKLQRKEPELLADYLLLNFPECEN